MTISGTVTRTGKDLFGWDALLAEANLLAYIHGIPTNTYDPLNALQHAYVSS